MQEYLYQTTQAKKIFGSKKRQEKLAELKEAYDKEVARIKQMSETGGATSNPEKALWLKQTLDAYNFAVGEAKRTMAKNRLQEHLDKLKKKYDADVAAINKAFS